MFFRVIVPFIVLGLLASALPSVDHHRFSRKPWNREAGVPRVQGGTNAESGEFPWMAQLAIRNSSGTKHRHWCGGSIIDPYWILTAAHCIYPSILGSEPNSLLVLAGSVENGDIRAESRQVEKAILHPGFNLCINLDCEQWSRYPVIAQGKNGILGNDVGLIKLKEPFKFSPLISPIALADFELKPGSMVTVSGFGCTDETECAKGPDVLQKLNARVANIDSCVSDTNQRYRCQVEPRQKPESLCYHPGPNGETILPGDSGSPRVYYNESGVPHQVGIVSFGHPISFDMKVSTYKDWILETMASGKKYISEFCGPLGH